MALKNLLVAGVVATLATFTDAHSALLSNGKLLGKLNSGECFNCAVGQYPIPSLIPASAVDATDPADGIAAYITSKGLTVKEVWNAFATGTSYGSLTEPEAIKSGTCGRYDPTAVGEIPSGAKISYKKSNHNGPGEIWVDDKKTWYGADFITDGKSITTDAFACSKASCLVHWYWIGKVKVKGNWDHYQVYVQCFNVKGSGSGTASDADATTAATTAPAASADDETPASSSDETPAAATDDETPAAASSSDATPGTVAPSNATSSSTDDKAAKKAAKEAKKAAKAAAKAAKKAAKSSGSTTADATTSGSDTYE